MVCFVMIRHVNSEITNNYWIECYNRIRKYYPEEKILIIDSNSNYDFITEIELINTTIIQSEFKARGEILGYFYYYKSDILEDAIIIQDSMFINQKIDFDKSPRFLWNFNGDSDESIYINNMLDLLDNNAELLEFYNNKNSWNGCFASCSIINKKLLETLDTKYNFFNLLNIITTQNYAMGFERLFAVLFLYETKIDINDCSIFGSIFDYILKYPNYRWSFTYNDFIHLNNDNIPIIKIWSNR